MKIKLCCIICAVLLALTFYGCAEDTESPAASASVSTAQGEEQAAASPAPTVQETQEAAENPDPESTTVTGEYSPEAPEPSPTPVPASAFSYTERYEGDGYSFRYPRGAEILSDEETVKSFLLPGQEYVLNITRLNLGGQDITLSQALPVYRKVLEDQGNIITATGTAEDFSYENALFEMEMKDGNSTMDSVQVFFLADGYNYTFTVSSHEGDMKTMKEIATRIVKSFVVA